MSTLVYPRLPSCTYRCTNCVDHGCSGRCRPVHKLSEQSLFLLPQRNEQALFYFQFVDVHRFVTGLFEGQVGA